MQPQQPREQLEAGVVILQPFLTTRGFAFRFAGEGRGSGGYFAYGHFVKDDRNIELHHRWGLGLVTYRHGDNWVDHATYLKALGVDRQSNYLWLPLDSGMQRYHGLLADLQEFCSDFLDGASEKWRAVAMDAAKSREAKNLEFEADYVGDKQAISPIACQTLSRRC